MPIRKRIGGIGMVFLALLLFYSHSFAITAKSETPFTRNAATTSSAVPLAKQGTHRNNSFGLTVTNYGILGNQAFSGLLDSFEGLPTVSFEFPLNSKIEYLFQGALWVGGIVNGDTLVSVGTDGWIIDPFYGEVHPSSNPAEVTAQKTGGGAQEIIFNYTDTLADPAFVDQDPADARPHRPLKLSFLQKSFVFTPATGADSFAILYLRMQNIGAGAIESLYFGLFMDNDAGHINTPNYFVDDVAGFVDSTLIPGTPLVGDIACIWDNDGDPSGGIFRPTSPTAVTGVKLIGSSQPLTKKSFNWWTPNGTVALDWGPQKAPGRLNQSGGRGQPEGDAMKYYYMSNGEIDYPQVRSAIDQSTAGWLPPLAPQDAAVDIANGFDARYLVSFGSFDMPPGDTLVLVFAAALGKNLHIDPNNFGNNYFGCSPNAFRDSVCTNRYLRGLRFGSLIHNIQSAESLWNTGFQNLVLGPPVNVRFIELDASTIRLLMPRSSELENGFNVYRSTDSNGTYVKVNTALVTDTIYGDGSLSENQKYWYKFSTVSISDNEGPLGGRIGPAVPGRPQTPSNLTDFPDKFGNIRLSWQPSLESALLRFRIYRAPIPGPFVFSLLDSIDASETTYVDPGSIAGQRFWYRITAVDTFGLVSSFSDTVRAMRFVFGNKALLVDRSEYYPLQNVQELVDSLSRFHARLLRRLDFDSLILRNGASVNPAFVSQNPVIVVHSSEFWTGFNDSHNFLFYFIDYLKAGGKLIVAGHWPIAITSTNTTISFCGDPFSPFENIFSAFGLSCLHFVSSYPWDTGLNTQSFLFAEPKEALYPTLLADSSRVGRFIYNFFDTTFFPYPTLPNVGYLTNSAPTEDLYTFGSILGGSDPKDGQTVAKKHLDPNTGGGFICFNFPLFYMQEDSAKKAFRQALADLGIPESFFKADLNRDGVRTIVDVTLLINWVFLEEQFPVFDADEADLNCNGQATPADVVLLLLNIFASQPLPCN